jgi:predicted nucleic acid-binding protein
LVVDASAALAALVDDDAQGRWARSLMAQDDLVGAHVLPAEITSALRGLVMADRLTSESGRRLLGDALDWSIELYPFVGLEGRVWELRDNLTPYDAWYVALAERLEAPLATLDRRLAAANGARCEFRLPD